MILLDDKLRICASCTSYVIEEYTFYIHTRRCRSLAQVIFFVCCDFILSKTIRDNRITFLRNFVELFEKSRKVLWVLKMCDSLEKPWIDAVEVCVFRFGLILEE